MIRFATASDLPAIRALWEICFPDDTGFNPYYFDHLFSLSDTLLYMLDDEIAAMVQMLPYTLRVQQNEVPVTYIYGACTHPDFRRKHLMSALLSYSFDWDQQHGRKASMLIPQEQWLFDFYRPFGYLPQFSVHTGTTTVVPQMNPNLRVLTQNDLSACAKLYHTQTSAYDMAVERSTGQWQAQLALFQALGAGAFAWEDGGELTGYAFVWKETDGIWAQECICSGDTPAFLAAIAAQTNCTQVRFSAPGDANQVLGCIKFYDTQPSMCGYMNLMLN